MDKAAGKVKTVTLTDVRAAGPISLFWGGDVGAWVVRAAYQVLDNEGMVRGSGVIEFVPGAKEQGEAAGVWALVEDAIKNQEGLK